MTGVMLIRALTTLDLLSPRRLTSTPPPRHVYLCYQLWPSSFAVVTLKP